MTTLCPDCLVEVPTRKPGKDGRCDWCRSQRKRRHSDRRPQTNGGLDQLIAQHRGVTQ